MEEATHAAATLNEAIAAGPLWLRAWIALLILTHVASLVFVFGRVDGKLTFRPECAAIIASFIAAALAMDWIYQSYGYVRLLGLAHLIFWTPAYAWVIARRSVN